MCGSSKIIYMKKSLSSRKVTWIIGLICRILQIIRHFSNVAVLTEDNYTAIACGLAVGTTLKRSLNNWNSANPLGKQPLKLLNSGGLEAYERIAERDNNSANDKSPN
jgi:hypothetical protein